MNLKTCAYCDRSEVFPDNILQELSKRPGPVVNLCSKCGEISEYSNGRFNQLTAAAIQRIKESGQWDEVVAASDALKNRAEAMKAGVNVVSVADTLLAHALQSNEITANTVDDLPPSVQQELAASRTTVSDTVKIGDFIELAGRKFTATYELTFTQFSNRITDTLGEKQMVHPPPGYKIFNLTEVKSV